MPADSNPILDIQPGLRAEVSWEVTPEMTAAAGGHDASVVVFSTPQLCLLAEIASGAAIRDHLPPGTMDVGTRLEVRHLEATPVGFTATARAELVAVAGNRLTFHVEVVDNAGKIGEVTHERRVVDWPSFMQRLQSRKVQAGIRGGSGVR